VSNILIALETKVDNAKNIRICYIYIMNSELIVVIPTYNAGIGIIKTIQQILANQSDAQIIVVDDNSPDKTATRVKRKFNKSKNVSVLVRKGKGGRGSAVIAGFSKGLENKKAKYFIEMDADECHNPKYIAEMIKQSKKSDIVIVSKYLPKSTITGLNLKRKLMSKILNACAKVILQVPISDDSNGYRLYKRPVVEYLTKLNFQSKGFVVLSEIIYRAHKKGFKISEIPFDFIHKSSVKSNMNFGEVKEAFSTLVRLRFS
jgi:dolichol-phosphate mannosyltransferase